MRRIVIIGTLIGLVAAGCGGGDDAATTTSIVEGNADQPAAPLSTEAPATTESPPGTPAPPGPSEYLVTEETGGAVLRVQPGDVITVRLTVEDPANPLWILATEPDPAIVEIVDSILWTPSEPGAAPAYFEFGFWVIGLGDTAMTFSLGPLTPTSRTVVVLVESTSD